MATVTYNNERFTCTTALKGTDYIHLLDASGDMIVAFDSVADFSGFSITGGSWTSPKSVNNCNITVWGEDGVIRSSTIKPSDIPSSPADIGAATANHTHTPASIGAATADHTHNTPNPNILDNWYFGNPVNQQGETSYTNGYTIDRWRATSSTVTVSIGTGKTVMKAGSETGFVRQSISSPEQYHGKTITISALTASGEFITKTGSIPSTMPSDTIGVVVPSFASGSYFGCLLTSSGALYAQFKVNANTSLEIVAAKLELGDTQTLAHQDSSGKWVLNEVPNYAEQMAICKQYDFTSGAYLGFTPAAIGAAALNSDGKVKAEQASATVLNLSTATAVTLGTEHCGKCVVVKTGAKLTIPTDKNNTIFPIGAEIEVFMNTSSSAGVITLECEDTELTGFATSNGRLTTIESTGSFAVIALKKTTTATWIAKGDIA